MPLVDHLTSVDSFGPWSSKRDDRAAFSDFNLPSGSKVRQYLYMSGKAENAPLIVGCSATSAMQVYVAFAAKALGTPGIVYVPKRNTPSASTAWARGMGVEVNEVSPGYLSFVRKLAKDRAKSLGPVVRWDVDFALRDTTYQCQNVPHHLRRVVVPVGTGLICAGIMAGLALYGGGKTEVLGVGVSDMSDKDKIVSLARKMTAQALPNLTLIRHPLPYDRGVAAVLPDGSPLDPYYAAKALAYVQEGDCLWVPGVRPLGAFPKECLDKLFQLNPGLSNTYREAGELRLGALPNFQGLSDLLPPLLPTQAPETVLDLLQA